MADLENANYKLNIGYGINNTICPLTNSIFVIVTGKFFGTGRSWVGGQFLDALDDAKAIYLGGGFNLLGS
jgi:hypothetical protein